MNDDSPVRPQAKAEMLIRRPVDEVFNAFINREITTKFWFTKSTGKLEENRKIEWSWEMYNHTVPVLVKTIETNQRIVVEWGNYDDLTTIEFLFKTLRETGTFVSILNYGFQGDSNHILTQVRDSTEGFTLVLSGLKALLEHGIKLNLIADRFPKGLE